VLKYVYLISDTKTTSYKIGTSSNPEKRLKSLQTGNDNSLKIIHKVQCKNKTQVEKALHNQFSFFKISGEWFELKQSDVDNFPQTCQTIDENLEKIKSFKLYL
jgi:hypothetical protein